MINTAIENEEREQLIRLRLIQFDCDMKRKKIGSSIVQLAASCVKVCDAEPKVKKKKSETEKLVVTKDESR
jgi:hypothetical protein